MPSWFQAPTSSAVLKFDPNFHSKFSCLASLYLTRQNEANDDSMWLQGHRRRLNITEYCHSTLLSVMCIRLATYYSALLSKAKHFSVLFSDMFSEKYSHLAWPKNAIFPINGDTNLWYRSRNALEKTKITE